jgi:hypothetical protein
MESEGIVLGPRLAGVARIGGEVTVPACLGVLPAVKREVAIGKDLRGNRVEPPVDQIEMMRPCSAVGSTPRGHGSSIVAGDRLRVATNSRMNANSFMGRGGMNSASEINASPTSTDQTVGFQGRDGCP